jgi:hypothetical protein
MKLFEVKRPWRAGSFPFNVLFRAAGRCSFVGFRNSRAADDLTPKTSAKGRFPKGV